MRPSSRQPAQLLGSTCQRYRADRAWQRWNGNEARGDYAAPRSAEATLETNAGGRDCEESPVERRNRLETVLLLAKEPLSSRKLAQLASLEDGTEARTLIRRLNESYDDEGRAFRVEEVAGGYQLLTRRKFSSWLRRLAHVPGETRLSAPALETLAVIAYRQPVLRADVEAIRGVNCGEILRQLMERDLVRISGRSEELGRPFLYATTRRFLNLFGLHSLEDLPRAEETRNLPVFAGPPPLVLAVETSEEQTPSGQDVTQGYTGDDEYGDVEPMGDLERGNPA